MSMMVHIATSGHRKDINENHAKIKAREFVSYCLERNFHVVLGGAIGWDTFVAIECVEQNVSFEINFAFRYQFSKMPIEVTDKAFKVKVWEDIYNRFKNYKFLERDKEMVDISKELHVYWDGRKSGGTFKTMEYAKDLDKLEINWFNNSNDFADIEKVW